MPHQVWLMMKRSFVQQSHNKGTIIYDFLLLMIIGVLTGVAVKSEPVQYTLATLIIGLTAALASLSIFGPEASVFKREARSGISALGYLIGKVGGWRGSSARLLVVGPISDSRAFLHVLLLSFYPLVLP